MIHYVRGYFDAEGGVPSSPENPYLYFAQKDRSDLVQLWSILNGLGIHCGKVHNPSRAAAPHHWRFYVSRHSIRRFACLIGSWHPRKGPALWAMVGGFHSSFEYDSSTMRV